MTEETNKKPVQPSGISIGGSVGSGAAVGHGASVKAKNIAGRDMVITLAGKETPVDKEPTIDEFKLLLVEILAELAAITDQQAVLNQVDASVPFIAQGATASITEVAQEMEGGDEPPTAQSLTTRLESAAGLLTNILDKAKVVAEKTSDAANAVKPLVGKLEPLVQKVGVAALWAAKLWTVTHS